MIRHGYEIPHPGLEHPAGICRARHPSQKAIVFPAHLDQFDQQLARSPVANFDAYDSYGIAALSGRGILDVQVEFSQSAASRAFVVPPSLVRRGIGSTGP